MANKKNKKGGKGKGGGESNGAEPRESAAEAQAPQQPIMMQQQPPQNYGAAAPVHGGKQGAVIVVPQTAVIATPMPLEQLLAGHPFIKVDLIVGSGMCGGPIEFAVYIGPVRLGTARFVRPVCGGDIDIVLTSNNFRLMSVQSHWGACAGGACATYEYQIQAFAGTPASYHRMGKAKAGIGFCEGLSSKLFLDNGQPVVEHDGFQPGCCAHEAQLYSPGTKAKLGKLRLERGWASWAMICDMPGCDGVQRVFALAAALYVAMFVSMQR